METIIQFENREKTEKNNQIYAALFLFVLTISLLYNVELTTLHFTGIILLLIGVAFSIIANRTDNFPDIRQLNTIEYLMKFKENTLKRNKMHINNAIIGLLFFFPGCYLTYKDSFPQLGNWWMPIMIISGLATGIVWFVKYNNRSKEVLTQVTHLLDEFNEQKES